MYVPCYRCKYIETQWCPIIVFIRCQVMSIGPYYQQGQCHWDILNSDNYVSSKVGIDLTDAIPTPLST